MCAKLILVQDKYRNSHKRCPSAHTRCPELFYKPSCPTGKNAHWFITASFFIYWKCYHPAQPYMICFPLNNKYSYGLKKHHCTSSVVAFGSACGDPCDISAHLSPFFTTSHQAPVFSYPENSYHPDNLLPDFCLWFFGPVGWRMYMWECLAHGRLTPSACQLNSHPASLFTKAAL